MPHAPKLSKCSGIDNKQTGNKKVSTLAATQNRNIPQKLTVGMDLGGRRRAVTILTPSTWNALAAKALLRHNMIARGTMP
jgi:hypothetical protein